MVGFIGLTIVTGFLFVLFAVNPVATVLGVLTFIGLCFILPAWLVLALLVLVIAGFTFKGVFQ